MGRCIKIDSKTSTITRVKYARIRVLILAQNPIIKSLCIKINDRVHRVKIMEEIHKSNIVTAEFGETHFLGRMIHRYIVMWVWKSDRNSQIGTEEI